MLEKRRTGKERRRSKKINCKSSPKAFNKLFSLGVNIMLWAGINEWEINLNPLWGWPTSVTVNVMSLRRVIVMDVLKVDLRKVI